MICPYCKKEIEPVENENSTVSVIKDEKGRMKKWTEEIRDVDGMLLSRRVDEYTYYKTGETDTINQKRYDGEGNLLSEKDVKHFIDNNQSVVFDVKKKGGE